MVTKSHCLLYLHSTSTPQTSEVAFNIGDKDNTNQLSSLISGIQSLQTKVESMHASFQTPKTSHRHIPSRFPRSPSRIFSISPRSCRRRPPIRPPTLHRDVTSIFPIENPYFFHSIVVLLTLSFTKVFIFLKNISLH